MTDRQALRKDIRKWTKIWLRLKRGDEIRKIEHPDSSSFKLFVWNKQLEDKVPCFSVHCSLCTLHRDPISMRINCNLCPFNAFFHASCGEIGNPWTDFYNKPNTFNTLKVRDGLVNMRALLYFPQKELIKNET